MQPCPSQTLTNDIIADWSAVCSNGLLSCGGCGKKQCRGCDVTMCRSCLSDVTLGLPLRA